MPTLINFSIFSTKCILFRPSLPIPPPTLINYWGKIERIYIYISIFAISQKEWVVSGVFYFVNLCKEANICCQLFTSFCRSNRMFVDAFIEYVSWSYWWTWCISQIICNSKRIIFFVFYLNVSNKMFSTPSRLLNLRFSNPPPTSHLFQSHLLLGTQE